MGERAGSEVTRLLAELVAIDSINPDLVPGGAGEGAIAAHVAAWLEAHGLEVELSLAAPGRPNVVARAPGRGGGRSLLLLAHSDTVGVAGMVRPHEPRIEAGRLYGRGAFDMKAGLAAAMCAAVRLAGTGLRGDVLVAAVADEEFASIGVQALTGAIEVDGCIVTEPTGLELCVAHRGFAWLEVETAGRAAHGSRPDLGIDAIARMGPVLVELAVLGDRLRAGAGHSLLGTGSLHASLIEGGQELSSYPDRCLLQLERRSVPGEDEALIEAQVREAVARSAGADAEPSAAVRTTLVRDPFEVDESEPVVQCLARAATATLGAPPRVVGHAAWMDAAFLAAAGIPTVVFGPAGGGAHATVEWADLASLERCTDVLVRAGEDFCG